MVVDPSAIVGVINGFKAATELAELAINARDAGVIRAKAIELQREILAAQSSALAAQADQFAMSGRVRELEKEVAELKAWDAQTQRYQLYDIRQGMKPGQSGHPGDGAFVYRLKGQTDPAEPVHLLCAHCFVDRHKSILQQQLLMPGACDTFLCHRCGNIVYRTGHPYPEHFGMKPKRSPR